MWVHENSKHKFRAKLLMDVNGNLMSLWFSFSTRQTHRSSSMVLIWPRQDDIDVKYQLKLHHFKLYPITVTWSSLVSCRSINYHEINSNFFQLFYYLFILFFSARFSSFLFNLEFPPQWERKIDFPCRVVVVGGCSVCLNFQQFFLDCSIFIILFHSHKLSLNFQFSQFCVSS